MIIVQLLGGLGNQMFQYALGRHLAILNSCELKMDTEGFATDHLREYQLNRFCLPQAFAAHKEINTLKYGHNILPLVSTANFFNRVSRRLTGIKLIKKHTYIIERQIFSFCPEILKLPGNLYLEGYWQAERYFVSIRERLLKDFSLKTSPDAANSELLEQMKAGNSVSVHVRRGDYASDPATNRLYACCNQDYYQAAKELIGRKIKEPRYFIFSDDPDWAEANLNFENRIIVRGNSTDNGHEDLRLMQNCRHNIIANSSFSWWGAWLNQNPDKVVIAPKTWINLPNLDTRDLIPEGWLRI